MKKLFYLMAIIIVFTVCCVIITSCYISNYNGGTTSDSVAASTSTVGTTLANTTTKATTATTNKTTSTTKTTTATKATTKLTTVTTKATTKPAVTTTATTATPVTPKNITIFLDPGHGGSGPGVVRTYGGVEYTEADINLSVALAAKEILEKRGYTVVMSRETDKTVALDSRAPMAQNAGADMLISIHVNSFKDTSVAGPRMYYTHRTGLSYDARGLATYFADEFDDILDVRQSDDPEKYAYPNMKHARVASDKDLYGEGKYLAVTAAKDIPTVLIEMGFITNDNDFLMLKSQWWQKHVANAIADAVDAYNE